MRGQYGCSPGKINVLVSMNRDLILVFPGQVHVHTLQWKKPSVGPFMPNTI